MFSTFIQIYGHGNSTITIINDKKIKIANDFERPYLEQLGKILILIHYNKELYYPKGISNTPTDVKVARMRWACLIQ
jgi:hypothetical protein